MKLHFSGILIFNLLNKSMYIVQKINKKKLFTILLYLYISINKMNITNSYNIMLINKRKFAYHIYYIFVFIVSI